MDPRMPTADEIRDSLDGLTVQEVSGRRPDIFILGGNTLEDLKSFASGIGESVVFMERVYVDRDALAIRPETLLDLPLEILGGVQLDSHRFNRDLAAMDLSSPVEIILFAVYRGREFGIRFVDQDLDTFRGISPEERVEGFVRERLARNVKPAERPNLAVMKEDPLIERFSDLLIKDPEFRKLRTDDERFYYVIKIARRPGNAELKEAVMREDGRNFTTEKVRKVVRLSLKKMDVTKADVRQMVFDKQ